MNPLVKLTLLAAALAAVLCGETALGQEGRSLLELRTPGAVARGRLAARTAETAYLFTPAGRMEAVPLAAVTDFRRVSPVFTPATARALADDLRDALGPGGAVFRTRHYVVVRHGSRTPGTFGARLERIYAAVSGWFGRRGAAVREPEFPLVAVVLPDFAQFAEVAAAEGLAGSPGRVPRGLAGYYSPATNRLTVWEPPGGAAGRGFDETLVHEAVHQIAFNGGLHHRTGGTPRWVVEGLATALEAPRVPRPDRFRPPGGPREYRTPARLPRPRRPPGTGILGEPGLRRRRRRGRRRPAGVLRRGVGADVHAHAHPAAGRTRVISARSAGKTAADPDAPADRRAAFVAAFGEEPARLERAAERFLAEL